MMSVSGSSPFYPLLAVVWRPLTHNLRFRRFARKSRSATSQQKDVCHIWEVAATASPSAHQTTAASSSNGTLIAVPFAEPTIHQTSCVVAVSLQPDAASLAQLPFILRRHLDALRLAVDAALDGLERRGSKRPQTMRDLSFKRYTSGGVEHPDRHLVQPIACPLVLCATHYDQFAGLDLYACIFVLS